MSTHESIEIPVARSLELSDLSFYFEDDETISEFLFTVVKGEIEMMGNDIENLRMTDELQQKLQDFVNKVMDSRKLFETNIGQLETKSRCLFTCSYMILFGIATFGIVLLSQNQGAVGAGMLSFTILALLYSCSVGDRKKQRQSIVKKYLSRNKKIIKDTNKTLTDSFIDQCNTKELNRAIKAASAVTQDDRNSNCSDYSAEMYPTGLCNQLIASFEENEVFRLNWN